MTKVFKASVESRPLVVNACKAFLTYARMEGVDPHTDPIELRESLATPDGYESEKEDSKPKATKRKAFSDEEPSDEEEEEVEPKRAKSATGNDKINTTETAANTEGQVTNTTETETTSNAQPTADGTGNLVASQGKEDKDSDEDSGNESD